MAPMTEKQMLTIAVVQPRPQEVKVNGDLETNNNTRMVDGSNIDYGKLISPGDVPSKNLTSNAATTPTQGKKAAAEAKKPQVWMRRSLCACAGDKAANRFPDLPLHWTRARVTQPQPQSRYRADGVDGPPEMERS